MVFVVLGAVEPRALPVGRGRARRRRSGSAGAVPRFAHVDGHRWEVCALRPGAVGGRGSLGAETKLDTERDKRTATSLLWSVFMRMLVFMSISIFHVRFCVFSCPLLMSREADTRP